LIRPWDSTAVGTNSLCDENPAYRPYLTTLLDAANSAAVFASRDDDDDGYYYYKQLESRVDASYWY